MVLIIRVISSSTSSHAQISATQNIAVLLSFDNDAGERDMMESVRSEIMAV
jgi:hypothetical protein